MSTSAVFETTDVDIAHQVLCETYGKLRLTVADGRHRLRLTQQPLGSVLLHRVTFEMRFDVEGSPLNSLGFGRVIGGSVVFGDGHQSRGYHTAGEVFLAAQPDEPYRATVVDADHEFAFISQDLLAQVADGAPGRAPRPLRFVGYEPVTARAADWWNATYDYVQGTLTASPAAVAEPIVTGALGRLLAVTALSVFPHDGLHEATIEDRHDAHPASLRRAIAFIDENAHRDISPANIAEAAHVTIRTLQLAFRRHLDTTPNGYLRRARLEHAHRDLLDADPRRTTVVDIALRWGFSNHSRFTALYRRAFGVTPSQTLRRR